MSHPRLAVGFTWAQHTDGSMGAEYSSWIHLESQLPFYCLFRPWELMKNESTHYVKLGKNRLVLLKQCFFPVNIHDGH